MVPGAAGQAGAHRGRGRLHPQAVHQEEGEARHTFDVSSLLEDQVH